MLNKFDLNLNEFKIIVFAGINVIHCSIFSFGIPWITLSSFLWLHHLFPLAMWSVQLFEKCHCINSVAENLTKTQPATKCGNVPCWCKTKKCKNHVYENVYKNYDKWWKDRDEREEYGLRFCFYYVKFCRTIKIHNSWVFFKKKKSQLHNSGINEFL